MSLIFLILIQFHCKFFSFLTGMILRTKGQVLPVELPDNAYKLNCLNIFVGINEFPQVILFSVSTVLKNNNTSLLFEEQCGDIKELVLEVSKLPLTSHVTLCEPLLLLELNFLKLILNFKFSQLTHQGEDINWCLWSRKIF